MVGPVQRAYHTSAALTIQGDVENVADIVEVNHNILY
jgi:hypothetical protein